jgi:hypothetical protein
MSIDSNSATQALQDDPPAEDAPADPPADDAAAPAAEEEAPAEDAAPAEEPAAEGDAEAAPAADDDDEEESTPSEDSHSQSFGASGDDVFGKGSNSSVVGFLGFSKEEPGVLGIPFPVIMFLCVICGASLCITTGCLIARNTDILKVCFPLITLEPGVE